MPWFVADVDGKPDFRVVDGRKIPLAVNQKLCWLCGEQLGPRYTFCLGPMCAINRTISEPPSHLECMLFAVKACPFLILPKAKRREANLPTEGIKDAAGFGLKRNPGAVLLWTTKSYRVRRAHAGAPGVLFHVGDPISLSWWAEGREATREEVEHSINTGLPHLEELAQLDGPQGLHALRAAVRRIRPLLPRAQKTA